MNDYELPDPEKNPLACLVLSFKVTKGTEYDDRAWDKVNWTRTAKAARLLLDICGSLRAADSCMVEIGEKFDRDELTWTLETICRHAPEWLKKKRGGVNGAAARKRLFSALAERKSEETADPIREVLAAGKMPPGIRGLPDVQSQASAHQPRSGNSNGHHLEELSEEEGHG